MSKTSEILQKRRKQNEINLENRIKEVCEKDNHICEYNDLIRRKNIERIMNSLKNNDTENLSEEISELTRKRDELLSKNGFPLDYLEMKYHCDICKDTGSVGTQVCECVKKIKIENLYELSEIGKAIEEENFENFDFNVFRKDRQEGEEISPYENMKDLYEQFHAYSEHFDTDSVSLYLYGPVGTGKTYMLNSIAKKVLDNGYSVIYLSETQLINDILEYKFAFSDAKAELKPKYNIINNCDLLIIDDLGANNTNDIAKAALFEVLNTRLVKKLPVIISSNLDPEDLRQVFDMRIYSRIVGKYFQRRFYGNDIRMRR